MSYVLYYVFVPLFCASYPYWGKVLGYKICCVTNNSKIFFLAPSLFSPFYQESNAIDSIHNFSYIIIIIIIKRLFSVEHNWIINIPIKKSWVNSLSIHVIDRLWKERFGPFCVKTNYSQNKLINCKLSWDPVENLISYHKNWKLLKRNGLVGNIVHVHWKGKFIIRIACTTTSFPNYE